tara:strand:+ start:201 stop:452 length:252 start_codon:yes stop_codon:yes gene_type:complete
MIKVEVFSKKECHLCEEAKKMIYKVEQSSQFPLQIEEIDIMTDSSLYERFKEEIPVIFINGKKAFKYRVDEKILRKKLAREFY